MHLLLISDNSWGFVYKFEMFCAENNGECYKFVNFGYNNIFINLDDDLVIALEGIVVNFLNFIE